MTLERRKQEYSQNGLHVAERQDLVDLSTVFRMKPPEFFILIHSTGLQANLEQYPEEIGRLFKVDDRHGKRVCRQKVWHREIHQKEPFWSCESSAVSVIYHLLRMNLDPILLVSHGNSDNFELSMRRSG